MLLWLILSVLTGVVVLVVAWPLLRSQSRDVALPPAGAGSLNVYKDQLAEIDGDLARGAIGKAETEAAKIELSRRLLAQAAREPVKKAKSAPPKPDVARSLRLARVAVVAAIPLIAVALYSAYGVPDLPGRPQAAKPVLQANKPAPGIPKGTPDVGQLIAQVEARLREAPEDGRGWDVIAPVYLRDQRYAEARTAYARAIALLGETPKRLLGLAESAIRVSNGQVTAEARAAFEKILKAEPNRIEPRFWLAVAREQSGDVQQAAEEYRALLALAPADAPWRATVVERLAAIAPGSAVPKADVTERGPTAEEAAAAASMKPEARQQMIAGMVDSLHARLKANGRDPAGWQRLLRSYAVLGDLPKANAALAEARRALAEDSAGLTSIDALAREMGLGS